MRAVVVTAYGGPDVLEVREVPDPEPGPGQIRIRVRAAGVGPTDLHIRAGHLQGPFPLPGPGILGFEAAGTVDRLGDGVTGVAVGDEVAVLLPALGGYAELAVSSTWVAKPAEVTWDAAAALPSSAEAAVAALRQVAVGSGDTLLVYGGAGSVGQIVIQLARVMGARVIAVASPGSRETVEGLGAVFVATGDPLADAVGITGSIDALIDAVGAGDISGGVALVADPSRTVTLTGVNAVGGVRMLSSAPDRAPDALDVAMPLLASGQLILKARRTVPLADAASAHAAMEAPGRHDKVVLVVE